VLLTNFNISSSLFQKSPNSWVIYIGATDLPKVRELVLPYLHSSMYYKVHAGPKPALLKSKRLIANVIMGWCRPFVVYISRHSLEILERSLYH
jgi:hypothetical protein